MHYVLIEDVKDPMCPYILLEVDDADILHRWSMWGHLDAVMNTALIKASAYDDCVKLDAFEQYTLKHRANSLDEMKMYCLLES